MTYTPKPDKPCVVCGVYFPPERSRATCSDECGAERRKQTARRWREENEERERERQLTRRAANLDAIRTKERERQRRQRGTDPADFIENRDPEAQKARERERWRRGQASRRERLREAAP